MDDLTDVIIETTFENMDVEDFPVDKPFGLKITYNDVLYEFFIKLKSSSNRVICLGSGLFVDDEELYRRFHKRPVFHRCSWNFGESCIYYNDPTRYLIDTGDYHDDLRGGFSIGSVDNYHLETIKDIILSITAQLNVKNSNILFYGSSMGGFMSMMLGTMIRDSKVVADIPLTDLFKTSYSNDLIKRIWVNIPKEQLQELKYRLIVIEMIKKQQYVPDVLMIHTLDNFDLVEHCISFLNQLTQLPFIDDNRHKVKVVFNPEDGHVPLKEDAVLRYINLMFLNNFDNSQIENILTLDMLDGDKSDAILSLTKISNDKLRSIMALSKADDNRLKSLVMLNDYLDKNPHGNLPYEKLISDFHPQIKRYFVGRVDIKNYGDHNEVKLLKISDNNSAISYPKWFSDDSGRGLIIHSCSGTVDLEVQSIKQGNLEISVGGYFIADNDIQFPIYIDVIDFKVNDEPVIKADKTICYDKPLTYKKEVSDSEVTKMHLSWKPLDNNGKYESVKESYCPKKRENKLFGKIRNLISN